MASRLHRLIRIIRLVRGKRYPSVQELCHTLQIKERTLFNDLKELKEDLGVEIKFNRAQGGYYLEKNDVEMSFSTLDEESAFLLLAAFDLLAQFGGEALAQPLRISFDDEITVALGDALHRGKQSPRSVLMMHDNQNNVDTNKDVFIALCRACLNQEKVRLSIRKDAFDGAQGHVEVLEVTLGFLVCAANQWRVSYRNGTSDGSVQELNLSEIAKLESI